MDNEIQNGDEVKDHITGFKGVVTSIIEYLTGCDQAFVQPSAGKDGAWRDGRWIDLPSLKLKTKGKIKPSDVASETKPGGPGPAVAPPRT